MYDVYDSSFLETFVSYIVIMGACPIASYLFIAISNQFKKGESR